MNLKEKRTKFLKIFFKKYSDINLDLQMRIFPFFAAKNEGAFDIEWIDYTNNQRLLFTEEGISGRWEQYKRNGLVNYIFEDRDIGYHYKFLLVEFYNADIIIEKFMRIFYLYFKDNDYEQLENFLNKEHSYFHNGE